MPDQLLLSDKINRIHELPFIERVTFIIGSTQRNRDMNLSDERVYVKCVFCVSEELEKSSDE